MKGPNAKPTVKLLEQNGNAFMIMGTISKALKKAGADEEYVQMYMEESQAGDYDNLLRVALKYADVE